jgi:hypothetical protein
MTDITSTPINDGDPVTADTLRKIVENINKIATIPAAAPIEIKNTTITGTSVTVANVLPVTIGNRKSISISKKITPGTVTFPTAGFTSVPVVNLSIEVPSGKIASTRYFPMITSVSATQFTYAIIPLNSTSETTTKATLHWTASGSIADATKA